MSGITKIELLPLGKSLAVSQLPLSEPFVNRLVVADTYVDGAEKWDAQPWGWSTELSGKEVLNIDHHAPTESMRRQVSSGNLAIEYVHQRGALTPDQDRVLINHCDCDSIISAAILAGLAPADDRLGRAVIAADHTGAADPIADALQPLEALRDLDLSLLTLQALLDDTPLPEPALRLRAQREQEREQWRELVQAGSRFGWADGVAWLEWPRRVPGELLVTLLPDAWAILTATPGQRGGWVTKLRLGPAAPAGLSLSELGIPDFDPGYGGRWNAGSNTRGGGGPLAPEAYANELAAAIHRWAAKRS